MLFVYMLYKNKCWGVWLQVYFQPAALECVTHLNCVCQTRKSELTRNTWRRRHILRLWLHPTFPSSGSLFYLCVCVCVCVCVSLQWLYPQRRQTAAVWRRRCRRGTANLPQGHRNSSSLKWVSTPNRTFITSPSGRNWGNGRTHTQIHTPTHLHTGGILTVPTLRCFRSWSVPCLWRRTTGRSGPSPSTTSTTTAKSPER